MEPHQHDVLSGKGKVNQFYQNLTNSLSSEYFVSDKHTKCEIAREIVHHLRTSLDPPGRFLEEDERTGQFTDIGDDKAILKVRHALNDKKKKTKIKIENGEIPTPDKDFDTRELIPRKLREVYAQTFPHSTANQAEAGGPLPPGLHNSAGFVCPQAQDLKKSLTTDALFPQQNETAVSLHDSNIEQPYHGNQSLHGSTSGQVASIHRNAASYRSQGHQQFDESLDIDAMWREHTESLHSETIGARSSYQGNHSFQRGALEASVHSQRSNGDSISRDFNGLSLQQNNYNRSITSVGGPLGAPIGHESFQSSHQDTRHSAHSVGEINQYLAPSVSNVLHESQYDTNSGSMTSQSQTTQSYRGSYHYGDSGQSDISGRDSRSSTSMNGNAGFLGPACLRTSIQSQSGRTEDFLPERETTTLTAEDLRRQSVAFHYNQLRSSIGQLSEEDCDDDTFKEKVDKIISNFQESIESFSQGEMSLSSMASSMQMSISDMINDLTTPAGERRRSLTTPAGERRRRSIRQSIRMSVVMFEGIDELAAFDEEEEIDFDGESLAGGRQKETT